MAVHVLRYVFYSLCRSINRGSLLLELRCKVLDAYLRLIAGLNEFIKGKADIFDYLL
jgi:hypothetical protein